MALDAPSMPFSKRLSLYLDERFPLPTHLPVATLFFAGNYFLAERLSQAGPLTVGWKALGGLVVTFLTFFFLRVLDEFKDYATDVHAHPERVVSRGIMPLSTLRVIGSVIWFVLMAVTLAQGPVPLAAYCAVLGFAGLMYKEFFVGEWLKRHIVLYALSHQGITPLLCFYVYVLSTSGTHWHPTFWAMMAMASFMGLSWEFARKVRTPDDESPLIDTYSKHFGPEGAALLAFSTLVLGAAAASLIAIRQGFTPAAWIILALGGLTTLTGFIGFWRSPSPKGARRLGDWASALMVGCYVAVLVGAIAGHGVRLAF